VVLVVVERVRLRLRTRWARKPRRRGTKRLRTVVLVALVALVVLARPVLVARLALVEWSRTP
jgi:hypothetical protein